jgi:anti-anti-sigma regulatory factor
MFACAMHGVAEHPVLTLSGNLTLEHSREIHAALMTALEQGKTLTLDLRDSEKLDISFIQLLCALLKNENTKISFVSPPAHLLDYVSNLGADSLIKEITNRIEDHV